MKLVVNANKSVRTWTTFWDMHSGGGQKDKFSNCFIEAPEKEAKSVFYSRFGHNPDRVSCTCCGEDYSISEELETLEEATEYHRGTYVPIANRTPGAPRFDRKIMESTEDYIARDNVVVIWADEISEKERHGDVPEQGYVYVD